MGMMIIVGVLKASGVFQWLAYKSFEVSKGKVFLLCSALCVVTATVSAFLDNVTTMMLMTPVTMEIAVVLGISPFVLLVPEILASNFGGTATLIGDPPNIMIGSYAGITFNEFVLHLTPCRDSGDGRSDPLQQVLLRPQVPAEVKWKTCPR